MAKKKRRRIPVSASGHRFLEYQLGDFVKYEDKTYKINGTDSNDKQLCLLDTKSGECKWVPFVECKLLPF